MGVQIDGMDEWLAELESLPGRAPVAFRQVLRRAGVQIKLDWKARWEAATHPHGHIPHLLRSLGFDESDDGAGTYTVTVGVDELNRQAFLAEIIEYGTLTSSPHPGGIPSLEAETPKMETFALKVAGDLLEEGR